jgi:MBG domain (YGX type)/Bacterial Ig-like domain (group 3)/Beta-propeller repeat
MAGASEATDFPVTPGAFQTKDKAGLFPGEKFTGPSGVITKLNPSGSSLVYSTYLGGTEIDTATAVAVDGSGEAYITGIAESPDFPTTKGAFQTTVSGFGAFFTKLNPSGSSLVYSSFLSGTDDSGFGSGIAVDSSGDAFVAGFTAASDFPVTPGAFQRKGLNSCGSGFVTKVNPTGTALIYSTYLGGSAMSCTSDNVTSIAIDNQGDAYVTGNAGVPTFPTTPGSFQPTFFPVNDGFQICYAAKFNPTGSALVYSTFLESLHHGGTVARGIAVDSAGDAYITGSADSSDSFPVTKGTFQLQANEPQKIWPGVTAYPGSFLVKLNPSGSGLVYSTILGSSIVTLQGPWAGWAGSNNIALDTSGDVYVAGETADKYFPTSETAFQTGNPIPDGSTPTGFIVRMDLGSGTPVTGTATTVSTNPSPGIHRLPVTLNVNVAGTGSSQIPTGTVDIYLDNVKVETATLDSSGNASYVANGLTLGNHPAWARYWGDSTFDISIGNPNYNVVVSPDTTVTVASSVNNQYLSQPVTFTAAVASKGVSGTPTGTMSVSIDGTAALTTALPSSGQVSYTTSTLAPGMHKIVATYGGDSIFDPGSGQTTNSVQPLALHAISGGKQESVYGSAFQSPLTVQVTTLAVQGSPVSGIPVTFGGQGLSFSSTTVLTDANGQAQATATPVQVGKLIALVTIANGPNWYDRTTFNLLCRRTPLQVRVAYPQFPGTILRYGDAIPTPTAYVLKGLVNGDTAATAVTGAPEMSTTATSTSPVGVYPIHISRGTLAAQNYYINWLYPGSVEIYRANLTLTANSYTIQQGQPIPTLGYAITGFVNGDTQAIVTGAPVLSTTATSASPPGVYPILISSRGSLYAGPNYQFPYSLVTNGTLTIQPATSDSSRRKGPSGK